ncbi:MAG: PLP-dependent aminotransferase family protein [Deltaproteobacteria bacterium]|nr:PLP-dependent aminotransferase family protein [Deltaproteobacteria bacterium]
MWTFDDRGRGAGAKALFARVARAVTEDIRRGTLRAGDRLPSTRALAEELGVNRNTVVAAYDELLAQGWITSRGARGTFVAGELPDRPLRRVAATAPRGIAKRPGYAFEPVGQVLNATSLLPDDVRFTISAGVPDPRVFPRVAMARAYRRALRSPASTGALSYGDPRGTPRLRAAIAAMLRSARGIPAGPENILVTRGSQLALDLAARALLRPGDVAAVECLGYRPAWRAFEQAGARLAPIPLDDAGLVVEALAGPGVRGARCVYATPHHQYPTTVLLSPARRLALAELARRERFAILEDDYDHEFHYDGRPVAPLASADVHGNVIYLGSFSKILAPGLRLGYLAAPEPLVDTLAGLRDAIDRMGDHVLEHAVAELIEEGELERHVQLARRAYGARRAAFADLLAKELRGALTVALPAGGITLWARADDGVKLDAWQRRARALGVAFATAKELAVDGKPRPYLRLAFARYDEAELAEAVRLMRRAL